MNSEVTQLLIAMQQGDDAAADSLLPIVYEELRALAAAKMSQEAAGHTLQPTALVHEAYLRLVGNWSDASKREPQSLEVVQPATDAAETETANASDSTVANSVTEGRNYFFASASEAMRRILVENARRKNRLKRGGDRNREELDFSHLQIPQPDMDLVALDEALNKLDQIDPAKALVVKLRYFMGLTIEETARTMEISPATAKRYWTFAKAWLRVEMEGEPNG